MDAETRCVHYHSPQDIIAIKMKCCGTYYPCIHCHNEEAGHETAVWPAAEFDTAAVLCGACNNEMTIRQYLQSRYHCPFCGAAFNPNCSTHNHLYFSPE